MDFKIMSTLKLMEYVKTFVWTRTIKQLHIHHTWQPDHSDYTGTNGMQLQISMRNYHVNTMGWKDIAQHLTLLPDGQWVTGRDFNIDPASIKGWNEDAFAIEMLGNFDNGYDKFKDKQAEAMFDFCAFFINNKKLDTKVDVKFHRDNPTAGKTCPGSGIDREWFMNKLNTEIEAANMKSNNSSSSWKYESIGLLAAEDLLHAPEDWKKRIDEPMPVWAVLTVINNVYQKLSKK